MLMPGLGRPSLRVPGKRSAFQKALILHRQKLHHSFEATQEQSEGFVSARLM